MPIKRTYGRCMSSGLLLVVCMGLTLPAFADDYSLLSPGSSNDEPANKTEKVEAADEERIQWEKPNLPPRVGPKQSIAVGKFDTIGSFTATYGNWDIGGGLSAMLTTALNDSGYFIVSERANIQQILTEQEMKGSGAVRATSGPQLGNLTGVNLMVYGAVTEFGAQDSGGGMSLGFSGGGLGGLLNSAISRESTSGTVAMDLRVVDTTTGNIIDSFTVKETIENSGFDISVGYDDISLGTNKFMNTPLGATTRKAIVRAVEKIALTSNNADWSALVVDLDGEELYINAGRQTGIAPGQKFVVERVTKRLIDPSTGELLGTRTAKLGMVEVTEVMDRMSMGKYLPLTSDAPQAGDLVKATR